MQEYVNALNDIVAEGSQNVTDTLLLFVLGGKNCAVCLRPIMKSGITVESSLGPVIVCDQSKRCASGICVNYTGGVETDGMGEAAADDVILVWRSVPGSVWRSFGHLLP